MLLNESLQIINDWCTLWDVQINFKKSACMTVSNKKLPSLFSYAIGGDIIKCTKEMKYLGITITHDLKWSRHVVITCGSAQRKLGLLKRKLKFASSDVKPSVYWAIARPSLEYASIVRDPYQQ